MSTWNCRLHYTVYPGHPSLPVLGPRLHPRTLVFRGGLPRLQRKVKVWTVLLHFMAFLDPFIPVYTNLYICITIFTISYNHYNPGFDVEKVAMSKNKYGKTAKGCPEYILSVGKVTSCSYQNTFWRCVISWVLSEFDFLIFVKIWVLEFCHNYIFLVCFTIWDKRFHTNLSF